MFETFQDLYKTLIFNNKTSLTIKIDDFMLKTPQKDINSYATIELINNSKKLQKDETIQYFIVIKNNLNYETFIPIMDEKLVQVVLNILLNKNSSPVPFSHLIDFFQNRKNYMTKNFTNDIEKMWIHIEGNDIYKAQEQFNQSCDDLEKYNKNIEVYFSFTENSISKNYYIGYGSET